MSRAQLTILTNICLIEDLETQRVVMQYRSPETNRWSGYAFPGGHVIMYADTITQSMQCAINETACRWKIKIDYNEDHGIVTQTIKKEIRDLIAVTKAVSKEENKEVDIKSLNKQERKELVKKLEKQMQEAVEVLDFELAAQIRDMMLEVKALD